MESRDVACPGCGYNLRDLKSDRCPECGQQLQLRLGLAEPRQAALIAGLVALAAGAGFGGLLLVYGLIMVARFGSRSDLGRFFMINGVGFVAHAAGVAIWVRNWNNVRRSSGVARRMLVIVCFAMPVFFIVVFSLYIR